MKTANALSQLINAAAGVGIDGRGKTVAQIKSEYSKIKAALNGFADQHTMRFEEMLETFQVSSY